MLAPPAGAVAGFCGAAGPNSGYAPAAGAPVRAAASSTPITSGAAGRVSLRREMGVKVLLLESAVHPVRTVISYYPHRHSRNTRLVAEIPLIR
ncbi:hypothetical protein GCM10009679_42930 [Saccharothrix algeriensis]